MPPHIPDLRVDVPYFAGFSEGRAYIARVPGVVQAPLSTEQLAQVLNLVLSRFSPEGSQLRPYTVEEIASYQQEALLNPKKLRDELIAHKDKVALTGVEDNSDR